MSEDQSFKLEIRGKGDPRGDDDTEPADIETDLAGAIASDKETRFVRVHRYKIDGSRPFIATVPADGFGPERIRELWGAGSYQVYLLNNLKRVRTQGRVDIDGPTRSELLPPAELGAETEIAKALREMRELVQQIRNPPAAAVTADPIASAIALTTAMQAATAPLLEAVLRKSGGGNDQTELFLRAMRMGLKLAESRGKPDPLERLLDDFALPLLGKINGAGVPRALPDDVTLQIESGAPAAATPEPPPGVTVPDAAPEWVRLFAPYIGQLCKLAMIGRSPAVWGGVIADELTDEQADGLYTLLSQGEQFRGQFFTTFPDAAKHRIWFDGLMDELTAALEPEPPAATKKKRGATT